MPLGAVSTEQPPAAAFAAAMACMGPFAAAPRLAAGVSGGADSLALALLARDWARAHGGSLLALVVDHGLRSESGAEAALTVSRLAALGIDARLLKICDLRLGSAMAERARAARYEILARACAEAGIVDLLVGHHAEDQAETAMIRVLSRSGDRGLAAMPAVAEGVRVRLLRPLLRVSPDILRSMLRGLGVAWVDDPSNRDRRALRPRLRLLSAPFDTRAVAEATRVAGRARAMGEAGDAEALARLVTIRPEGFAIVRPGALPAEALAALIRALSGQPYGPSGERVEGVARERSAVTVGGVRFLPAGRLGPGWLAVREASRMHGAIPAVSGAVWDGRFRLVRAAGEGLSLGALGRDARELRAHSDLPHAVLATLPAIRRGKVLVSVPLLGYPDEDACAHFRLVFSPSRPVAGAPFLSF